MPFLGIEAASIVLVLAMVCLAVFAALTLSSAKGDHTLSKKNLERTSAFYQASNAANEQVGAIDEKLWKLYRRSKDEKGSTIVYKKQGDLIGKKRENNCISGKYHRQTAVICEIADLLSGEKK